jgi:hypothetical protein
MEDIKSNATAELQKILKEASLLLVLPTMAGSKEQVCVRARVLL